MSDLVEEVARSIYDADNDIDGDQVGDMLYENDRITDVSTEAAIEQTMRVCRSAARAAIKATLVGIREPSEAMKQAGLAVALREFAANINPKMVRALSYTGIEEYRAMIDALAAEIGNG